MAEHLARGHANRHHRLADKSDHQHLIETGHCLLPSRTLVCKLPPVSPISLLILTKTFWPHPRHHTFKREPIETSGKLILPTKINHPSRRGAVRTGVEIFSIEVGEKHFGVPRICSDPLPGLLGVQDETLAQHHAPLENYFLVLHEAYGFSSDATFGL